MESPPLPAPDRPPPRPAAGADPAGLAAGGDAITVRGLRLWAHVGVLEAERRDGQWFELDLELRLGLAAAAAADDLAASCDYAEAITALLRQARTLRCRTLEHYSDCILERLEQLYGAVPMALRLTKCRAPVPGFSGRVAVERRRHWPAPP